MSSFPPLGSAGLSTFFPIECSNNLSYADTRFKISCEAFRLQIRRLFVPKFVPAPPDSTDSAGIDSPKCVYTATCQLTSFKCVLNVHFACADVNSLSPFSSQKSHILLAIKKWKTSQKFFDKEVTKPHKNQSHKNQSHK